MARWYEWTAEYVVDGDIEDSDFGATLKEVQQSHPLATDFGLVLNIGNEHEGVTHRSWAYLTDDGLPERFEDGTPVPARYIREARQRQ